MPRKPRAIRRDAHPPVRKLCPWGPHTFEVPYKKRHQTYCSHRHHALSAALRRKDREFKAMGHKGGLRSGQVRRQLAVNQFLTCVQGPMRMFGTTLYLLGFMHGQNTVALRFLKRKKARRG